MYEYIEKYRAIGIVLRMYITEILLLDFFSESAVERPAVERPAEERLLN